MTPPKTKRILFLLRTYNDIDHIAPIIWKATSYDWPTYFVFIDKDYSDDYRIRYAAKRGAVKLDSKLIDWYYSAIRERMGHKLIRKLVDRLVAYSSGLMFLQKHRIQVVATEWTGHFGRGRSEYFLRPARLLNIPVFSLPHGYFLWRNSNFNKTIETQLDTTGEFPDFSNRNWFYRYVVQSIEHKDENIKYRMDPKKIVVLGSARFCLEWSRINGQLLARDQEPLRPINYSALFFLPHWDYQVFREKCIGLLFKIIQQEGMFLYVKAHTRGSGALTQEEADRLRNCGDVSFPGEEEHSALLVKQADIVINFGSSIAFEALRQGKPVINPCYLHGNSTFFDGSGAVFDTTSEAQTLELIQGIRSGTIEKKENQVIEKFLQERVDGGEEGCDVLQSYLNLFLQDKDGQ
jgi:hypothetical protein